MMSKKLFTIFTLLSTLLISGCSCSLNRSELIEQINKTKDKTAKNNQDKEIYKDSKDIIDFYNKISINNTDSIVLVESKNPFTNNKKISNGVVVGETGIYSFILVDYYSIYQGGTFDEISIIDSYYNIYDCGVNRNSKIEIYNNYLDDESGLAILCINNTFDRKGNSISTLLTPISIGSMTSTYAYLTSLNQFNKVEILENIKSSTLLINSKEYTTYDIDSINEDSGSIIINFNNKLASIYSSKLKCFLDNNYLLSVFDLLN